MYCIVCAQKEIKEVCMVNYDNHMPRVSDVRAKERVSEKPLSAARKKEPIAYVDKERSEVLADRSWLKII